MSRCELLTSLKIYKYCNHHSKILQIRDTFLEDASCIVDTILAVDDAEQIPGL